MPTFGTVLFDIGIYIFFVAKLPARKSNSLSLLLSISSVSDMSASCYMVHYYFCLLVFWLEVQSRPILCMGPTKNGIVILIPK